MAKSRTRTTLHIPLPKGGTTSITLEKGMTGEVRKGKSGPSVTLHGYGAAINIRQRHEGKLQLRAPWLKGLVPGISQGRMSSGTHEWPKALAQGTECLRAYHEHRQAVVSPGPNLTLHQAIRLARRKGLVPGGPGSETSRKTRRQYERALAISEAILHEDPVLPLTQEHIDRIYAVRGQTDEDEEDEWITPAFRWPAHLAHRRVLTRVRLKTVQSNLIDLRTVLRKLVNFRDAGGTVILSADPMAGLDLGNHRAEIRDTAGPHRFGLVVGCADEATARMRTEGLDVSWRRLKKDGSYQQVDSRSRLDAIPYQLEAMFTHQWIHPTRPKSWRHVRVDDIAFDRPGLVALRLSLRLIEGEWEPPEEIYHLWLHGAIAYRRPWSKLKSERMVPVSMEFARVLLRYLEARAAWLAERGIDSPWLYPSPRDPRKPIDGKDARFLLLKAELVARERLESADHNPDEWVPIFHRTKWYAYRRAWKRNRNELGWEGSLAAAYVGDWSINSGSTPDSVYARVSPRLVLAVVEGRTLAEATADEAAVSEAKAAAGIRSIDPATLTRPADPVE